MTQWLKLLPLLLMAACKQAPPPSVFPSPQVQPSPSPPSRPTPRPRTPAGLTLETPEAVLEPTATAELSLEPTNKHLLEAVAFKKEGEVLELLGEPDGRYLQGRLSSWYYLRQEEGSQGKKVCPELQFFEGAARFVIFWTPEAMREKIALAARHGGVEPGAGKAASYAFTDSFKYLAVGADPRRVLEDLGEPDARRAAEGGEEWDYDTLIVENGAARRLTVVIRGGRVSEIRGR